MYRECSVVVGQGASSDLLFLATPGGRPTPPTQPGGPASKASPPSNCHRLFDSPLPCFSLTFTPSLLLAHMHTPTIPLGASFPSLFGHHELKLLRRPAMSTALGRTVFNTPAQNLRLRANTNISHS